MKTALVAALLFTLPALAQAGQSPKPKPQVIDFEALEIEGQTLKPDVSFVDSKPSAKFDSLIRVRADFADKLLSSVNEL